MNHTSANWCVGFFCLLYLPSAVPVCSAVDLSGSAGSQWAVKFLLDNSTPLGEKSDIFPQQICRFEMIFSSLAFSFVTIWLHCPLLSYSLNQCAVWKQRGISFGIESFNIHWRWSHSHALCFQLLNPLWNWIDTKREKNPPHNLTEPQNLCFQ